MAGRGSRRNLRKQKPGELPDEAKDSLAEEALSPAKPDPTEAAIPEIVKKTKELHLPDSAVNASEFVPYLQQQKLPVVGLRETKGQDPPKLAEISYSVNRKLVRPKGKNVDMIADVFIDATRMLPQMPELFQELTRRVVETMNNWLELPETLDYLSGILFDEAVCNPDFRFMGAKMYEFIDRNLRVRGHEELKLRSYLLKRCEQEHGKFLHTENQKNERSRWFGFALFLGEMYRFVKVRNEPYQILGRSVIEQLNFLLADGGEDAMVICLALYKLAGSLLDAKGGQTFLTDLTAKLRSSLEADSSRYSQRLLDIGERTVQLRESGWDLGDVTSTENPFYPSFYDDGVDDADDAYAPEEMVDDIYFDGEMDNEAVAEFEKFMTGQV